MNKNTLISGGQDGYLMCWDLENIETMRYQKLNDREKVTIWSIDADISGDLVIAAYTDKII